MIGPVSLILLLLATARVTRLLSEDKITERPRLWLTRKLEGHSQLQYLIHCPWCLSMYVGAAAAGTWALWGGTMWYTIVTAALSASYVTGFLTNVADRGE